MGADSILVSMKSGLEDRNNMESQCDVVAEAIVSMNSGLEDRNNLSTLTWGPTRTMMSQ